MFLRMLVRAAILRRGRALSALIAITVSAAVSTALLTLQLDTQAKMQREFRNYGANIVISGREGASLPADAPSRVDAVLSGRGLSAPFGFVIARTSSGEAVVVAGTDFARVRQLNRFWAASAWPALPEQALIGIRALRAFQDHNQPFDLAFQGRNLRLSPTGTLQTGAAEDSRIYIALATFTAWTGLRPSIIEVSAAGSPAEIDSTLDALQHTFPEADVRPVRRIVEGEARVLLKTRSTMIAAALLVTITAALCVLSTLMGWLFDRRRDFAIMKAIGASDGLLNSFFMAESAALGVVGALPGFILGLGAAAWIAHSNFHSALTPRLYILPIIVGGSLVVTLLAALLPVSLLRRLQPAAILRGE